MDPFDQDVWPTVFHASSVVPIELEELRRVEDVVRLGRVKQTEHGQIMLEGGERASRPEALYALPHPRRLASP
jgi:hypothetical protein